MALGFTPRVDNLWWVPSRSCSGRMRRNLPARPLHEVDLVREAEVLVGQTGRLLCGDRQEVAVAHDWQGQEPHPRSAIAVPRIAVGGWVAGVSLDLAAATKS